MIRIRRAEDSCFELQAQQKIRGLLHLHDGEEAVAVGIAAARASGADRVPRAGAVRSRAAQP